MSWFKACSRGTRISSYLENLHRTSQSPPRTARYHGAAYKGNELDNLRNKRPFFSSYYTSLNMMNSHSTLVNSMSPRQYSTHSSTETKTQKMLYSLTAVVFGMVGLTYAAVPLYRTFCQATGYGGTVQRKETVEDKIARHSESGTLTEREIAVQLNADVSDAMPWKFTPTQREVITKPGDFTLGFYTVENKSSAPITGIATYNVTPMKAGVYFNKVQCFCYEKQKIGPGEQIDLPVSFYIDREFETDPRMDGINNLILSYTFFKVSEETVKDTVDNNISVPVSVPVPETS